MKHMCVHITQFEVAASCGDAFVPDPRDSMVSALALLRRKRREEPEHDWSLVARLCDDREQRVQDDRNGVAKS